ncbi:hypothetical protein, partial [Bradyrhizobium sp. SZCCHNR3027]|uniref:hypothetical protein n=1 Tax=Bradyrhizobium sp. SZCCHNR3027 TaxID=3057402 RepID=UPI0028E64014
MALLALGGSFRTIAPSETFRAARFCFSRHFVLLSRRTTSAQETLLVPAKLVITSACLGRAQLLRSICSRLKTNFARDFNPITPVQSLTEKYSCFYFSEIVFVYAHPASIKRGVSRSSQTLGAGCGGRVGLQRDLIMPTNSPMCTVKPRGPGIPVLMPSSRRRLRGRQG